MYEELLISSWPLADLATWTKRRNSLFEKWHLVPVFEANGVYEPLPLKVFKTVPTGPLTGLCHVRGLIDGAPGCKVSNSHEQAHFNLMFL